MSTDVNGGTRRSKSRLLSLPLVAVFALSTTALAACGSSSTSTPSGSAASSGSSSKAAAGTVTTDIGNAGGGQIVDQANAIAKTSLTGAAGSGLTRGVTSSSVTVGCITNFTEYAGFQEGIEARLARANKDKINGRTVKLLSCKNDDSNAQTNVQQAQQLVSQSQVFSLFSLSDVMLPGTTNSLNSAQVPFFGFGYLPGFCGTRWGFGWNGCIAGNSVKEPVQAVAGNLGLAAIKASGRKATDLRVAFQGNTSVGAAGNSQFALVYKSLGASVVYNQANFPATQTGVDNTPYVQAIMASKPDIVYLSLPFSAIGGLASALKAAGYKGISLDFTTYLPGLLASSPQLAKALDGEYISSQVVPFESNTPYIQQLKSDLQAIGKSNETTFGSFIGYAEADEFVEMIQAVGPNLDTKTFDQVVNNGRFVSYSSAPTGGPGKLTWPAAHYLPSDCASILKVESAAYKIIVPFSCYQSFKVNQ
jgi:branched-chain amino acid transport system substrate-binding protein